MTPMTALSRALPEELILEATNPIIYNPKEQLNRHVGDFYAQLTCAIFNGRLTTQSGVACHDAYLEALAANVEIKGRHDQNAVPLKTDQLDGYLDTGDGLYDVPSFVYAIWRYKSGAPKDSKVASPSLTQVGRRRNQLRWYLARRTHTVYLFDIAILQAIRRLQGTRIHRWPSNDRAESEVVYLTRSLLKDLFTGSAGKISRFARRKHKRGEFQLSFPYEEAEMQFSVKAILLPETLERLEQHLAQLDTHLLPGS